MNHFTAALLLVAVASTNAQADFAWDIAPLEGYPVIGFKNSDSAKSSAVEFKYSYAGTLTDRKFLATELYRDDCVTPADTSLAFVDATEGNELSVDVNIGQDTITDSVHYTPTDDLGTSAAISFCVRVDYNYRDTDGNTESINFHETIVDISVDLTANFKLASIATDRTTAASAELDYPVTAYFCGDDNVANDPDPLAPGSALQVCIKMDDSVTTEDVYVADILTLVVSQPRGPASSSTPIAETITDPLTAKDCTSSHGDGGICIVKTQLPSKFFAQPSPADLQVNGVAILAFGGSGRNRQPVAVPIQASLLRKAQDGSSELPDGAGNNRYFDIQVGLTSQQPAAAETTSDSNKSGMALVVAIELFIFVLALLAYCDCFGGVVPQKCRHCVVVDEDDEKDLFFPVTTRSAMMEQQKQKSSEANLMSENSAAYAV